MVSSSRDRAQMGHEVSCLHSGPRMCHGDRGHKVEGSLKARFLCVPGNHPRRRTRNPRLRTRLSPSTTFLCPQTRMHPGAGALCSLSFQGGRQAAQLFILSVAHPGDSCVPVPAQAAQGHTKPLRPTLAPSPPLSTLKEHRAEAQRPWHQTAWAQMPPSSLPRDSGEASHGAPLGLSSLT